MCIMMVFAGIYKTNERKPCAEKCVIACDANVERAQQVCTRRVAWRNYFTFVE